VIEPRRRKGREEEEMNRAIARYLLVFLVKKILNNNNFVQTGNFLGIILLKATVLAGSDEFGAMLREQKPGFLLKVQVKTNENPSIIQRSSSIPITAFPDYSFRVANL
jgi:hypothetical protein